MQTSLFYVSFLDHNRLTVFFSRGPVADAFGIGVLQELFSTALSLVAKGVLVGAFTQCPLDPAKSLITHSMEVPTMSMRRCAFVAGVLTIWSAIKGQGHMVPIPIAPNLVLAGISESMFFLTTQLLDTGLANHLLQFPIAPAQPLPYGATSRMGLSIQATLDSASEPLVDFFFFKSNTVNVERSTDRHP